MTMVAETCSLDSSGTSSSHYRKMSRGSNIDESLFGNRLQHKTSSSTDRLNQNGCSFVKKSDMNRMKHFSPPQVKTNNQCVDSNRLDTERRHEKRATSTAQFRQDISSRSQTRKKHMMKLELNSKNTQNLVSQKLHEKEKEILRDVAQQKIDESEDVVKLLNTCQQRAAAFAIRDKQLKDKEIKEKEEKDYERLMDISMEMNRLSEISAREKEEEQKIRKRIDDRKVIEDQIRERTRQKLLEEEARDQENRQMLHTIQTLQDEDIARAAKRKEDIKKSQKELIKWNEEILKEKEARHEFDKKEESMILAYQAQRDEALRKREEEENEARKEKVRIQKKLLEQHEKTMDKQSELDELRARRATEETERRHRQRELFEAQKRKNDMQILHEARKRQEDEKRQATEKEKIEKIEDFNNAVKFASYMANREEMEVNAVKKKNAELRSMLKNQIKENEIKASLREREKYEEGRSMKEQMMLERVKLEAIRERMVNSMKTKGVKDKYISEMTTLDIEKILMK